jgi:hypothetical protein
VTEADDPSPTSPVHRSVRASRSAAFSFLIWLFGAFDHFPRAR